MKRLLKVNIRNSFFINNFFYIFLFVLIILNIRFLVFAIYIDFIYKNSTKLVSIENYSDLFSINSFILNAIPFVYIVLCVNFVFRWPGFKDKFNSAKGFFYLGVISLFAIIIRDIVQFIELFLRGEDFFSYFLSFDFFKIYYLTDLISYYFYGLVCKREVSRYYKSKAAIESGDFGNFNVVREALSSKDKLSMKSERNAKLVLDLKERADRLYSVGNTIIAIILIALVFGALIVVFAGRITAWGIEEFDPYVNAKSDYDGMERKITENNKIIEKEFSEINKLKHKYGLYGDICSENDLNQIDFSKGNSTYLIEFRESIKADPRDIDFNSWALQKRSEVLTIYCNSQGKIKTIEAENRSLDSKSRELFGKISEYHGAVLANFAAKQTSSDVAGAEGGGSSDMPPEALDRSTYQILLTSTVTRFGVLAIIIYLVQILIGLYRYNAMVAAHYRSSADVLVLSDNLQHTRMENLQSILKPNIQYGKAPTSIPEKVAESVATVANGVRGRRKKSETAEGSET